MTTPPDRDAEQRQRASRRQGIAYQGATEAFVAILICIGIGYWADRWLQTSPAFLLVGAAVGFASFVLRLVRLGRKLASLDTPEDDANPIRKPR